MKAGRMELETLVIGAGMAGLACARRLASAGAASVVVDKGRGIGGRMATQRKMLSAGEVSFDHGAQYFTAKSDGFLLALREMDHVCAQWDDGAIEPHLVGKPGMSSLPHAMADGLDIRLGIEVTALRPTVSGWEVSAGPRRVTARRVIMTVPAPQAARLLGEAEPLHRKLANVVMAPCLTLMATFPADTPRPFLSLASDTDALAWVAQDSSKPGRNRGFATWVAQAGADWSSLHLELDPEVLAARMLPMLAKVIGVPIGMALHAAAHRWRYARTTIALGEPFVRSDDGTLYLAGDWCLGARVEAAWCSGDAAARDILAASGVH
jgi:predicted NAD/FAD-dependent oxidoreductase